MTALLSKTTLKDIAPPDLGRALRGVGVNLLVKNALTYAEQLRDVLGVEIIRAEEAYAIIAGPQYGLSADKVGVHMLIQIHADFTYQNNPYHQMLPELDARGVGVEVHLFETNPDTIAPKADAHADWTVLQHPTDKPHGVREAYLLDGYGYCWVVSSPS